MSAEIKSGHLWVVYFLPETAYRPPYYHVITDHHLVDEVIEKVKRYGPPKVDDVDMSVFKIEYIRLIEII